MKRFESIKKIIKISFLTSAFIGGQTILAGPQFNKEAMAAISKNSQIMSDFIWGQLFATAQRLAKSKKGSNQPELQELLLVNAKELSTEEKRKLLEALPYETKTILLEAIILNFLNPKNKQPFKIPSQCRTTITQWDMFCLVLCTLLGGPDFPELQPVKIEAQNIITSCIGNRGVWDIKSKFDKLDSPRFQQLIPKSLQERFGRAASWTRQNELRIIIKQRVQV